MQTVELLVVAGVDDDGEIGLRQDSGQAEGELGSTYAACEREKFHLASIRSISSSGVSSKSGAIQIRPFSAPEKRLGFASAVLSTCLLGTLLGARRRKGLPALAINTSSPCHASSPSSASFDLASFILTCMMPSNFDLPTILPTLAWRFPARMPRSGMGTL